MAPANSYSFLKRTGDIATAALGLLLLGPLMLLIGLIIRRESPGPALFRQKRLGIGGKSFSIFKFRTMANNAPALRASDGSYVVAENDPRLTTVGRVLREYSLDELPQLINVLIGEMSLVGPRPDQESDLALYDDFLRKKLRVKPGMTSLASVNGRNLLTWQQRTEWERHYVDHMSLGLDLKILWKTLSLVISRKGIYNPDTPSATPPKLATPPESRPSPAK